MASNAAQSSLALIFAMIATLSRSTCAFSLNSPLNKPQCEQREPCRVGFVGLEFCSCPNNQNCPNNPANTLFYENIDYHFCQPTEIETCSDGEVAWIRRGLRQTIHCTCPQPLRLASEIWDTKTDTTEYKCAQVLWQQQECRPSEGEICMTRIRVLQSERTISHLKGLCQCPRGQQCTETGETLINSTNDNPNQEVQHELFKCQFPATGASGILPSGVRTRSDGGDDHDWEGEGEEGEYWERK